jgi:hypothetical protein
LIRRPELGVGFLPLLQAPIAFGAHKRIRPAQQSLEAGLRFREFAVTVQVFTSVRWTG